MTNKKGDQPHWLDDYERAINNLIASDEIIEWKETRALEQAKILSVNTLFQDAINSLRQKYQINNLIGDGKIYVEEVLSDFTSHLSDEEYYQLSSDLEDVARKFNLDYKGEDEGLLVAALCYGITPDNILNHWESMKFVIARTRRPGVQIVVDNHLRLKEKIYYMIIIAHLCTQLIKLGGRISLPEPLSKMVIEALKRFGKIETRERAETIFQRIADKKMKPKLYIEVVGNTTLKDVQRTWPQVELRQIEYFGQTNDVGFKKRSRVWRTYARDVFIWNKVKSDGLTYEAAYDEWLNQHPDEEVVELTAVIKSVNRIEGLSRSE